LRETSLLVLVRHEVGIIVLGVLIAFGAEEGFEAINGPRKIGP